MDNYSTLEHHDVYAVSAQYPTPVTPTTTNPSTTSESTQHVSDHQYSFQKQVVSHGHEPVPADSQYLSQKQVVPGQPGNEYTSQGTGTEDDEKKQQPKTISGLPHTAFIISASLLFVVVLAVVLGSVLGTQLGNSKSGYQQQNSTYPHNSTHQLNSKQSNILATSRLSASNFTTTDGYQNKLVYFQDGYGHLICRSWDDLSRQWVTINITQSFHPGGGSYKPSPGSSIASVTQQLDGDSRVIAEVYFVDNENTIRSYTVSHAEYAHITFENNPMDAWTQTVMPKSDLTATYQQVNGNETHSAMRISLAYQDPTGGIYVSNDSDWQNPKLVIAAAHARSPSPIALAPYWYIDPENVQLNWATPDPENGVRVAGFELDDPTDWQIFDEEPLSFNTLSTTQPQHLAFCRDSEMTRALLFLRRDSRTISLNYWDGEGHPAIDSLRFTGGNGDGPLWGSIAATHGGFFYGIAGDEIREYQISGSDPGTFLFNSIVYP